MTSLDPISPPVAPRLSMVSLVVLVARAGVALGLTRPTLNGLFNTLVVPRRSPRLERYHPTEHDVFVTTFAKSGTNWAIQMCVEIAHRGAASYEHIHHIVAWPEIPNPMIPTLDDPRPSRDAPTGMRVIKTHMPATSVPYDPAARYVTVLRDPKDVLVSAYHFVLGVFGVRSKVSLSQWYELCVGPDGLVARWVEHAASHWRWRSRPNVFIRPFHALLADHAGVVDELAALMGVQLDAAQRAAVIERSSFAHMKANDRRFAPSRSPFAPPGDHPSMMRRGKAGDARSVLSPSQRARIDQLCRAQLQAANSSLPYDEFFADASAPAPP